MMEGLLNTIISFVRWEVHRMEEPWKMQGKEGEEGVKILKEWQRRIAHLTII